MASDDNTALSLASASLEAIQSFNAATIVRSEDLGSAYDFAAAKFSAERTVEYFKQVDRAALRLLPTPVLRNLHTNAESTRQHFQLALDFDPKASNAPSARDNIITSIESNEYNVFNFLGSGLVLAS